MKSMEDTTINELIVKVERLYGQVENLKLQQLRYESIVKSEAGTVERNRLFLSSQIDKIDIEIHDILFNSESGLAFIIDRLVQKDKERQEMRKHFIYIYIALGIFLIEQIITLVLQK